tara:strand:- start:839 stop:1801 length:963 start_codon:yes stop_codon:yes gene_type:complete
MKVIITGGYGYLGSRLSLHLIDLGYDVTIVAKQKKSLDNSSLAKIKTIIGDICQKTIVKRISSLKPDFIIHLVSLPQKESNENLRESFRVNTQSTWDLLSECHKNGLKKFIYFSTIHVYGNLINSTIDEQQTPIPKDVYGVTHLLSENICNYFNEKTNVECINVRLSNCYGEPALINLSCWELVINEFCKSAYFDEQIVILSDGAPVRDFIHYSDVCNGIDTLLKKKSRLKHKTINFCSGFMIEIRQVAILIQSIFQELYSKEIPIFINSNQILEQNFVSKVGNNKLSNQLAKNEFIFFRKNLKEGIIDLFNYLDKERVF